jgi:hypothetical protein
MRVEIRKWGSREKGVRIHFLIRKGDVSKKPCPCRWRGIDLME